MSYLQLSLNLIKEKLNDLEPLRYTYPNLMRIHNLEQAKLEIERLLNEKVH